LRNRALIDTDILSYYFKGDENVIKNLKTYLETYDLIEISIVTYYEIFSGLLASNSLKKLEIFESFANENIVIPLTEESCKISAKLYSNLKNEGNIIDDIDLLIAGIAIENEMILVTNNEKHFNRIPDLNIANWKHVL
jgi:tRNA(fMet)-specific endonuclease VapC